MPWESTLVRPRGTSGFTLIEVLIAVGLMALLTAVFAPSLGGVFRFEIRGAARRLAGEVGYATQRAVTTAAPHLWVVDLDRQAFRLEVVRDEPIADSSALPTHAGLLDLRAPVRVYDVAPASNRAGEWRGLETSGVRIEEVRIRDEKFRSGTVRISFGPEGGVDPAELRLVDDGGNRLRVVVVPFTGEVRILEGADA